MGRTMMPEAAIKREGMRVLIVVHGYPPTHTGGAEQRAARTARAFAARGREVRVLCVESLEVDHAEVRVDDRVQDGLPVRRLSWNASAAGQSFRESYNNPTVADALRRMVGEWRPDLVYLFSGYLMSASVVNAAADLGLPVVVALTDYWWLCHRINLLRTDGQRCDGPTPVACARCRLESWRRFRLPATIWPQGADGVWSALERTELSHRLQSVSEQVERAEFTFTALHRASAMIAPSRCLADFYARHGVDSSRIYVSRQGVQIDRCLLRTPSERLRVGYIGQVKPHKGVHTLLEAWGMLRGERPRRLSIHGSSQGDSDYERRIRGMLSRLDGVAWPGHFVGDQVWQVLADLDVVVAPSRWIENSPNAILEAQAVGLPVIGSNIGGVAELVEHDVNGLLFEVDDAADLARQLQRLLDEPDLLRRLRSAETPFATFDDRIDWTLALFDDILATPRRQGLAEMAGHVA